jgi:hypothetical protein
MCVGMSIATVVVRGCDLMASLRTGKRLGSLLREQPSRTSHHRINVDPCIVEW